MLAAILVDDAARHDERLARVRARNERRRRKGKPVWEPDPVLWGEPTAEPAGVTPVAPIHGRRLGVSTAIFGLATGLSRVLGLVREIVASYYFGAAGRINAFTVAFQVPNLVRALVADPALSPVFWNLAIILGLVIGVPQASGPSAKLYVYAGAILAATFIQVFLPMPWLRGLERGEERLRVVLDWRDPAVRQVFKLMVPVTLGLGLINVNALIDTFFAARYIDATLAPTAIQKAFLVYMLPQGMFSVAIATVLFPTLSRLASRGDLSAFADQVSSGIRQIAFLLAPTAVVSAVLAEPIIRILYQRGHWHPAQTPVVAGALAAFSAGLVFNGFMLMLNRAFFSLQSNWIPKWVALGNLGLNAILDFAFYRFGTWGIPLATAVCNVVSTAVLVVLLRARLGRIGGTAIAGALGKIVTASVLLAPAA